MSWKGQGQLNNMSVTKLWCELDTFSDHRVTYLYLFIL